MQKIEKEVKVLLNKANAIIGSIIRNVTNQRKGSIKKKFKICFLILISIYLIFASLSNNEDKTVLFKQEAKEVKQNEDMASVLGTHKDNNREIRVIGTIEFPKLKQVNNIVLGIDEELLNSGFVGLHYLSNSLDRYPNNIILAAHNRKGLFRTIVNLEYNDIVIVNSLTNTYTFRVIKIEELLAEELMNFIIVSDKRILTLITCIEENQKRLVLTLIE